MAHYVLYFHSNIQYKYHFATKIVEINLSVNWYIHEQLHYVSLVLC